MPRYDGTGPMGMGAMSGRGMGACGITGEKDFIGTIAKVGMGIGLGLGCRRGFRRHRVNITDEKNYLLAQKEIIETRLKTLKNELDNYNDSKE